MPRLTPGTQLTLGKVSEEIVGFEKNLKISNVPKDPPSQSGNIVCIEKNIFTID